MPTVVDTEVEFLSPVVAGYGHPTILATAGTKRVLEYCRSNVPNPTVTAQSVAEFSIFTVKEEALIEALYWAKHETGTHDLLHVL